MPLPTSSCRSLCNGRRITWFSFLGSFFVRLASPPIGCGNLGRLLRRVFVPLMGGTHSGAGFGRMLPPLVRKSNLGFHLGGHRMDALGWPFPTKGPFTSVSMIGETAGHSEAGNPFHLCFTPAIPFAGFEGHHRRTDAVPQQGSFPVSAIGAVSACLSVRDVLVEACLRIARTTHVTVLAGATWVVQSVDGPGQTSTGISFISTLHATTTPSGVVRV